MRGFALVVVIVAACGRHEPQRPPAECARLVQHVIDLAMGNISKLPAALQKPFGNDVPAYRAAVMQSCTNDRWSEASVNCLATAKSGDEAGACGSTFTPEAQAHLTGAYQALMAAATQAGDHWADDMAALINRLCACTDATCSAAAAAEYQQKMAEMRTTTLPDIKAKIEKLDAKVAECKRASTGSDCDEVSCTLDDTSPCCQRRKRAK